MKLLKLKKKQEALVFELLVMAAMAVVIFFALMNIGAYINGTISTELEATFPTAGSRSQIQNNSISQLENVSQGFDNNIDIMIIAALITVITIPLAAVVAIRRIL